MKILTILLLIYTSHSFTNNINTLEKHPFKIPACSNIVEQCRHAGFKNNEILLKCIDPRSKGSKEIKIETSPQQAMICIDAWLAIKNERYFFNSINFKLNK